MIRMNFPEPRFKTRYNGEVPHIFDELRRKWVVLTPEEWVRQNTINWLIENHQVPASHIAIERSVEVGGRSQRFDVLVYDQSHSPWMLIECKSQLVLLNEKVLMQVLRYNSSLPVNYIMITNGNETYIADHLNDQAWLSEMPPYSL